MNNTVILTDDELSLIMTALTMVNDSYGKYIQDNGETGVDPQTLEVIKGVKVLNERLQNEFF